MNYASIKSSDGGKGGPQYKDDQPLQGPLGSCAEAAAGEASPDTAGG